MDATEIKKMELGESRDLTCSAGIGELQGHYERLPSAQCGHLIESSWERCVSQYKLDRSRHKGPEIVTTPEFKDAADPLDLLCYVARPHIERLLGRLASSPYVVMLSDPNGIALDVLGDTPPDKAMRRMGVCTGALWGEDHAGTNGIGTSLATHSPVTIHRGQHFFPTFAGLTCTAAPIFGVDGEVIAALDASSVADLPYEMQVFVLDLIVGTARHIERGYFLERNRDRTILRVEAGLARAQEGNGLMLALGDDGCPVELYGGHGDGLPMLDGRQIIGHPLSGFLEITWQDAGVHHADAFVERIGIAHLKESGQPCFASLMTPKGRRSIARPGKTSPARCESKVAARGATESLGLEVLAGEDPVLRKHVATIQKLVDKGLPILLQGETGTGKEEFARGIHETGARADKPFTVIDCSSIPENLVESELFGYEAGTFTGAVRGGRKGRIPGANGGTLFLDEIGDMPLSLQTRLLRVLAQGEVTPLGTAKPVKVDFNVICATHRDLTEMVAKGQFRQDLYYRIAGLQMELPALRDRTDKASVIRGALEIEAARMDLGIPPRISEAAMEVLLAQPWPGNMRELRLAMRYALACTTEDEIQPDRLPHWLKETPKKEEGTVRAALPTAAELQEVLEQRQWCISEAADQLKVSRQTLYRWLKRHNISRPE
ncbi:sigma-54-dependent Fis family transcriptional regulator [Methyloligella sp. 2.7D]|uniref:sigma-54-dependent Fis family transcriptional regulator n=1 Tax=unclassified Methyloligella TaxID=2625955 RepID=UPI00157BDBAA|nr:sigma-54-dependent Fis family transcriptional regulator [Methyloligella sp. GL2]QKP76900.1 sigma-54-dependent Fis family transcriptional regulator [Methyloligella sp. GL2]